MATIPLETFPSLFSLLIPPFTFNHSIYNKSTVSKLIALVILLSIAVFVFSNASIRQFLFSKKVTPIHMLTLQSSKFNSGDSIPEPYSCNGANYNPPLSISGVPESTKSFALIVFDSDIPGGAFDHWVVWNIPSSAREIDENSIPENSSIGTNSFNHTEYNGPCPPSGTHHYHFQLLALDTVLDFKLPGNSDSLRQAAQSHIVDQTELVGVYTQK